MGSIVLVKKYIIRDTPILVEVAKWSGFLWGLVHYGKKTYLVLLQLWESKLAWGEKFCSFKMYVLYYE